jgi:hypothetical protein
MTHKFHPKDTKLSISNTRKCRQVMPFDPLKLVFTIYNHPTIMSFVVMYMSLEFQNTSKMMMMMMMMNDDDDDDDDDDEFMINLA